jgi:uroporphyrinogen-III synthase
MGGKVKTILISQPKPTTEKSPYYDLAEKHGLKIDFRSFIHVEPISSHDFRQERINILDHTAVILTSRNAVDHFFRMCTELRITVPDTMKYFCLSESTAYYLQKYVVFRKRKVFTGAVRFADLMEHIKKHKNEKYLLPCSDLLKPVLLRSLPVQAYVRRQDRSYGAPPPRSPPAAPQRMGNGKTHNTSLCIKNVK